MSKLEVSNAVWHKSSHSGASEGECVEVAKVWRKSSHSGASEGSCVEVAAAWRKSSQSGGNEGECVEVAAADGRLVAARDSKDPAGPVLCFAPDAWRTFRDEVQAGAYDLARSA